MVKKTESLLKISVVMCTYNGEKFINEQLDSILRQTLQVFEIIVQDDASADHTVSIIKEYSSQHPHIKLTVNNQNIGFTKNFEKALLAATGNVIAICDQDDVWMADKLERMIGVWDRRHPLIYCNSYIFSGNVPEKPKEPVFRMFEGTDARKIFLANTISGHAIVCTKDFLKLALPFSNDAMYDWWMGVVAAYNGGVQHYDKVLVFQRSHAANSTVDILDKFSADEQKNIKKQKLIKQSRVFMTAPNISPQHKAFLSTFATLLEESLTIKFHKPLFSFMVKNKKLLFNFKKKKVVIFSHLKHSYLWTLNRIWEKSITPVNNGKS